MSERVHVVGPYGEVGTVDRADVAKVIEAGGRHATPKEIAEIRANEAYEYASTGQKVLGAVSQVAGPIASNALAGTGVAALPPEIEAFQSGEASAATLGLDKIATKAALESVAGKDAGKAYAQHIRDTEEANPGWHTAGEVTGFAAMALGGSGAGLARAVPGMGVSALGGLAEAGASRALAGVATRGALGRAVATGGELAARGAVEGALYGAANQVTEEVLADHTGSLDAASDRVFAAAGMGALYGGVGGAVLGSGGSLAKSGVSKVGRGLSRMGRAAGRAEEAAGEIAAAPKASAAEIKIDADAGLRGGLEPTERAFEIGAERRPIVLKSGGRADRAVASEEGISSLLSIDPDAGLRRGAPVARDAIEMPGWKVSDLFEDGVTQKAYLKREAFKPSKPNAQPQIETRFKIDPDAGLRGGVDKAEDAFRPSSRTHVDREVLLSATDATEYATRSPINITPHPVEPLTGLARMQASAREALTPAGQKLLAFDQAWNAIGAGFGLQTTRFAKMAAKYFPNGTRDLGEVAIRHGVIDVGAAATPLDASLKAAMHGTPANMLPRIRTASEAVGQKIGDITETSGARITTKDVAAALDSVEREYRGIAGRGHVADAVRAYRDELLNVLGKSPDGTVSVQSLLEQRKGLDQIVYDEAKTLDPKGRVAALRQVRGKLEDVVTNALDDASGRMKGELAAEYKTLKKDFHALRILEEAAEDSAARASKSATFGLRDTLVGGLFGGDLASGAALGFGAKLVRERGNAAAAVLLYRMGEMASVQRAMAYVEQQLGRSAKGLLNPAKDAPARAPSRNPVQAARKAEERLAELTSKPERVVERAATVTQGLSTTAPTVAGNVARNLTRALAFLNAKLPPVRAVDPLAPARPRAWSQTEAAKFMRYVDAAEDPLGVLEDVERGKVTREGIETLRVLAPTMYRDLQIRTLDSIADHLAKGQPIPFETRLKLGTLLDVPADPSLNPRTMAFLQANLVPPPQPNGTSGGGPQRGASSKPLKLPTQHTAFDKLTDMKR